MRPITQKLYMFLSACGGNWRSSIYIEAADGGILMAMDRDGRPVFLDANEFRELTGEQVDPAECRGRLTQDAFTDIFAQYLIWHCFDSSPEHLREQLTDGGAETQNKEVSIE